MWTRDIPTSWSNLLDWRELERDPGFRAVVDRLARRGMVAAGALGLGLIVSFVLGVSILTDRPLVWSYPETPKSVMVLWDKLLVAGGCAVAIVLSRFPHGVHRARLIVAAVVTAAATAMVLDDVANRDWQIRYVTLALVVTVGLMPYRPLQTVGLCFSVGVASVLALTVLPRWMGLDPMAVSMESLHFLAMVTLVLCVVSGVLYRNRYGQFVARRKAEELAAQVRRQADELRRVEEQKDRFFANLNHELRTPLTLLVSPLDDALAGRWGVLDERVRQRIGVMRRNGARLLSLIDQLLQLSRMDDGKTRLVVDRTDLVSVVRAMVDSFSAAAESRGIALSVEAPDEPVELYLDREAIDQVLSNLLSNALKFTPHDSVVRVRVDAIGDGAQARARVSVRDSGRGIDPDDIEHVFDRFFRGSGPDSEATVGTGIGLALAAALTRRHGGEISAESEQGFGSEFVVSLPMDRDLLPGDVEVGTRPDPGRVSRLEPAGSSAGESDRAPGPDPSAPLVLVADDDPDVRDYLVELLSDRYRVRTAEEGIGAVKTIESDRPDLVVCDVMMPGLDGVGLCRRIRSTPNLVAVPVVLVTALAEDDARLEALREGADDYICKPFNPSELLIRVENLIELRRAMREHLELQRLTRPTAVDDPSADAVFLERAREVVEEHMADSNFTVEWMADEVGLSARQLSRRLQNTTGLSAGGYVRMLRLKRAEQLLARRTGTISEIAYAVGFRDAAHFSRLFKQTVGMTPSAFADRSSV